MTSMNRRRSCLLVSGILMLPSAAVVAGIPNDPHFELQWGLNNTGQIVQGQTGTSGADVDAPDAWDIHAGTTSVVVAIVGRGIDPHPEFADRLLEGRATVGDPFDTLDACPHDTHLAGIIAAATNDGVGIAGLNGRARLLPVRALEECGGIQPPIAEESDTAEAIQWAVDHGADIVLAAVQFHEGTDALRDAVEYAVERDVVIIAPVGSAGNKGVAFPAAFTGCLAVSATTNQDTRSDASNFGAEVDLAAPGRDIWSTWTNAGYDYLGPNRDTAAAAAFVAGVAALVRSYAPQLIASEVKQILIDSADDLGNPLFFGAGRVNARRALELAPLPALRFEHVEPLPTTVLPGQTSSFVVRIASVGENLLAGSAMLFYRSDPSQFALQPLTPLVDELFLVELPAVECETTVEYYLAATGDGGNEVTDPLDAPVTVYTVAAVIRQTLLADDFESDVSDTVWEVDAEGGNKTTGRWSRVIPVETSAQPGFDYSPNASRFCFVTGQHFGGADGINDVDGGPVLLTSPIIELTPTDDVEVSYARWFDSSGGTPDQLTVKLSRDGGNSWVTVETVASTGTQWVPHSFRLSEFPQITGDQLRVRFSTVDLPDPSLTEAAIDEFRVEAIRCSVAPGDANNDGLINLLDFGQMVNCWTGPADVFGDGICAALDFDSNQRVDLSDYRVFQNVFTPHP